MNNNPIGYFIHEEVCLEAPPPKAIKNSADDGKTIIEAVLQTADLQNRNGRIYSKKDLFGALEDSRLKDLMKKKSLKGECGHPLDKTLSRQQVIYEPLTSCRFLKIWTDGDLIKAWIKGTNNELGKTFDQDVKEGEIKQFSLRALGSLQNVGGKTYVKNLRIVTYDQVVYQSDLNAFQTGIVSEGANIFAAEEYRNTANKIKTAGNYAINENWLGSIDPINTREAIAYIRDKSKNLKSVFESFDICGSKISIMNENTAQVITPTGIVMRVGLESYIANEIMNYGR